MSDFVSLLTALSGLHAAQAGLDVTTNNIANASTPGRTRQRILLAENPSYQTSFGPLGAGVRVADVSRMRDAFLDARVRAGASALGHLGVRADLLTRLEDALGEPDLGVSAALSGLWASFEDLSVDPDDAATRTAVLSSLNYLTSQINDVAREWRQLSDHSGNELAARVDEANELLQQVALLNAKIVEESTGAGTPNNLLDERDVLLDRLSELVGAKATINDDGMARVSVSGMSLVSGTTVTTLAYDTGIPAVVLPSGAEVNVSGIAGGHLSVIRDDIPALQQQLDDFVVDLAAALNAAHAAGFTPAGANGGALLGYVAGSPALTVRVLITDPADLAAAGDPTAPEFDGDNAALLAGLRTALAANGGTASLEEAFRELVVAAGSASRSAQTSANAQTGLQVMLETNRLNTHGVSTDEEMVNLMQFQRSYEAAARVLTAVDEILELLVNRLGVVGR